MTAFCLLLAGLTADAPTPPGALKLRAGEEDYRQLPGAEVQLDGTIERNPSTGRPGVADFNVFRVRYQGLDGKEDVRELNAGENVYRISSHVGKKVRLAGKPASRKTASGEVRELWPAWLLPLSGPLALSPGPDGVYARCDWQPEEARRPGKRQYVFRSPEQLAEAMRVSGSSAAQTAAEILARRLNVPSIDWEKHMVLCVSVGLQGPAVEGLAVTNVKESPEAVRVTYRLLPGKEGAGFGYPAQTVLVNRSPAAVRFEQETAPPKP